MWRAQSSLLPVMVGLFVTFSLPAVVAAQPEAAEPVIAVLVVDAVNVPPAEALLLAEELSAELSTKKKVAAAAGAELQDAAGELANCTSDPACVSRVASQVGAGEVLFLVMVRVGESTRIDVEAGKADGTVVSREAVVIGGSDDRAQVMAASAATLLPEYDDRVDPTLSPPEVPKSKPERHMTPLTWGLVAGGAGLVVGGLSYGTYLLIDCEGFDCPDGTGDRRWIADVAAGVGVGALAVAGWLWFRSDRDEPEQRAGIQVGPGPGVAGLSVSGRF